MAKKPDETNDAPDDLNQFGPAGLRWLIEMEAVNSPVLQNNLYGNLYAFPHVEDVELIMDRYQRKMLIWVKFSWFVRKFLKKRRKDLIMSMLDQLQSLLPSFEFRITEDRAVFDLALKRMEEILFGGKSAVKAPEPKKEEAPAVPNSAPSADNLIPGDSKAGGPTSSTEDSAISSEADETDRKEPS